VAKRCGFTWMLAVSRVPVEVPVDITDPAALVGRLASSTDSLLPGLQRDSVLLELDRR